MRPALVIGAAACALDDLEAAKALVSDPVTIAANDGGVLWPGRLDHWATIHPDELPERERRRDEAGYPMGYDVWTPARVGDWWLDGGTSGLLAASVAAKLGHTRIVLCGVPFGPQGYAVEHMHHGTGEWPYWRTYQWRLPSLIKQNRWIPERVRSMSGFTRDVLGAPTREWLEAA